MEDGWEKKMGRRGAVANFLSQADVKRSLMSRRRTETECKRLLEGCVISDESSIGVGKGE